MANLRAIVKDNVWGLYLPPPTGINGVAQGDNTFVLVFIDDGPQIIASGSSVSSGTFVIVGNGTVNVLITGLAGTSRNVTGPNALIVNNADLGASNPYTVDNGVLDLNITTDDFETTIAVS